MTTYRKAISWIAKRSNTTDPKKIVNDPTVHLTAELWNKLPQKVARDVMHKMGEAPIKRVSKRMHIPNCAEFNSLEGWANIIVR